MQKSVGGRELMLERWKAVDGPCLNGLFSVTSCALMMMKRNVNLVINILLIKIVASSVRKLLLIRNIMYIVYHDYMVYLPSEWDHLFYIRIAFK